MVAATIFAFAAHGRFHKKKLRASRAITKTGFTKSSRFFLYHGYAIQYEALNRADVEVETIITLLQQC